jgi:hypothetical protein
MIKVTTGIFSLDMCCIAALHPLLESDLSAVLFRKSQQCSNYPQQLFDHGLSSEFPNRGPTRVSGSAVYCSVAIFDWLSAGSKEACHRKR